ncbi:MAG: hypothetical protein ACM3TR_04365 [Caulobacteraceae bacterium]
MERDFHTILLDALTEAIVKKSVVTVKNSENNSIVVITVTEDEIIISLSKVPTMMNDIVAAVSDCLGRKPDMIYNRISVLKEDFIIYYMVWLCSSEGKAFVEKEFSTPQNRITYMSQKALSMLESMN